jgi:hypothetical protein
MLTIAVGDQTVVAVLQTLYCYSPALLPKPADWPAHVSVVGPWLPPGSFITDGHTTSSIGSSSSAPQAAAPLGGTDTSALTAATARNQAANKSPPTLPVNLLQYIQNAR